MIAIYCVYPLMIRTIYKSTINFLEFKFAMVYLFFNEVTTVDTGMWGFWVEKTIAIGVLIWIVQDLKKAKTEATNDYVNEIKKIRESHKEELKETRDANLKIVEQLSQVHQQQVNSLSELVKQLSVK